MYEGLYTLEGHAEDAQGLHIAKSFLVCDHARILLDPVFCCKTASQGGRNVHPHFYFCFYLISFFSSFFNAEEFQNMHSRLAIFQKISTACSGTASSTLVNMQHAGAYLCMYVLCLCIYSGMYAFMDLYAACVYIQCLFRTLYKGELSHKTHFILHCGKNMYPE